MTLWHQTTGEGPPLLLVHGWGMNASVWQPWLQQLNKEFQVTCVELPGHGHSDLQNDQNTLTAWSDAVTNIAPANAIWLGWSLGGLIALQAVLKQISSPSSVNARALYMMTATPCFAQHDQWQCAMPVATLKQFALNLEQDVDGTLLRFLSLQIKGSEQAREMLKQLRTGFSQRPAADNGALKLGLGLLSDSDLRDSLRNIEIPVHWTFGERDTLVPACVSESIKQLLPDASSQIIKGAGHVPFLSHANECLQSLRLLAGRMAA